MIVVPVPVADPGFVKREARKNLIFLLLRQLHYWVGVTSAYQTDLRGDKQKKKKKIGRKKEKSDEKKGGGGAADSPPWFRH